MARSLITLAGCLVLVSAAGCRPPAATPSPDTAGAIDPTTFAGQTAFDEVRRFLDVGPRPSGSEGARRAAEYLQGRLTDMSVVAWIDAFTNST